MNATVVLFEVENLIDDLNFKLAELSGQKMTVQRMGDSLALFASIVEAWGWLAELDPTLDNRREAKRLRRVLLAMSKGKA
jgi:hypothetical protein